MKDKSHQSLFCHLDFAEFFQVSRNFVVGVALFSEKYYTSFLSPDIQLLRPEIKLILASSWRLPLQLNSHLSLFYPLDFAEFIQVSRNFVVGVALFSEKYDISFLSPDMQLLRPEIKLSLTS